MDGTLLRLEVDIEEVRLRLAALFRPYGVTRPFRPILVRLREAAGDDSALLAKALAILDAFEVAAAQAARARAGAIDAVQTLVGRGIRLGLVTDNGRACVPVALRAIGLDPGVFAAVVTRDDVALPKPDPAGLLACARALGVRAEESTWYVGDHPKDVSAARAASAELSGLRVAAVRGGWATELELRTAGADEVVGEVGEVLDLMGRERGG
jgi:HAD superfamily hydrolase (TIGR01549 family)